MKLVILAMPTTNLGLVNASGDVLKEFTTLFFMPVEMPMPDQVMLNYRLQYPLIRDDFYHRVQGGIQTLDILDKLKESQETSFLLEEDNILKKYESEDGNMLRPNLDLIKTIMENIFNLPHNKHTHLKNHDFIGGYIYQKFVKSGLLVAYQDFEHNLPVGKFAALKGSSQQVVSIMITIKRLLLEMSK